MKDPNAERIFAPRGNGRDRGDVFPGAIRVTYRVPRGLSFDVDPIAGVGMQTRCSTASAKASRLDFKPLPGTEAKCDPAKPAPPCIPSPAQLDPKKVYGWREGGGNGQVPNRVGKAQLWLDTLRLRAGAHQHPARRRSLRRERRAHDRRLVHGRVELVSVERYELDMRFFGQARALTLGALDMDKGAIAGIPVYVARQSATAAAGKPVPQDRLHRDQQKGTFQTDEANG